MKSEIEKSGNSSNVFSPILNVREIFLLKSTNHPLKVKKNVAFFENSTKSIFVAGNRGNKAVIPNRGAAAHYGAEKRCQGCRQISLFIDVLLQVVPQIFIFNLAGVPPIFFRHEGYDEPKKVEKH